MTAPDVHTLAERDGDRRATVALQSAREQATLQQLAGREVFDLANLSDDQFADGLKRVKLRQKRAAELLGTVLVVNVHYGTEDGTFKKPILKKAGAEELRTLGRLTMVHLEPPLIVTGEDFVAVTCHVGHVDKFGQILAGKRRACNSREKRFKAKAGGWTYSDAREAQNDCLAMAEKRAGTASIVEIFGLTAFFADEDAAVASVEARDRDDGTPWSADERAAFVLAASRVKVTGAEALQKFVADTLGETREVLQADLPQLFEALGRRLATMPVTRKTAPPAGEGKAPEAGEAKPAGDPLDSENAATDAELARQDG